MPFHVLNDLVEERYLDATFISACLTFKIYAGWR